MKANAVTTIQVPVWISLNDHHPSKGQRVRVLIQDPLHGRIYENPFDAIFVYHKDSRELPYFYEVGTHRFLSFVGKWKPLTVEVEKPRVYV